jgi:nitroreductase
MPARTGRMVFMNTMEAIFSRRSIRKYSNKKIPSDILKLLCAAGMSAPSAMNTRPWEFVIVQERKILDELSKLRKYWYMLNQADAAIVVAGKKDKYFEQNCAAATQNILLSATDHNIGSVWLGLYPNMDAVEKISQILSFPDDIIPFSVVALGYPEEVLQVRNKPRNYEGIKIHKDYYKA